MLHATIAFCSKWRIICISNHNFPNIERQGVNKMIKSKRAYNVAEAGHVFKRRVREKYDARRKKGTIISIHRAHFLPCAPCRSRSIFILASATHPSTYNIDETNSLKTHFQCIKIAWGVTHTNRPPKGGEKHRHLPTEHLSTTHRTNHSPFPVEQLVAHDDVI